MHKRNQRVSDRQRARAGRRVCSPLSPARWRFAAAPHSGERDLAAVQIHKRFADQRRRSAHRRDYQRDVHSMESATLSACCCLVARVFHAFLALFHCLRIAPNKPKSFTPPSFVFDSPKSLKLAIKSSRGAARRARPAIKTKTSRAFYTAATLNRRAPSARHQTTFFHDVTLIYCGRSRILADAVNLRRRRRCGRASSEFVALSS